MAAWLTSGKLTLASRISSLCGAGALILVLGGAPTLGWRIWDDYTKFRDQVLMQLGNINTTLAAGLERGNALRARDSELAQRIDRVETRVDILQRGRN